MLFHSWTEVAENSGMATGFAKLFAITRGQTVTTIALSPKTKGLANILPIFEGLGVKLSGYETLGDTVFKMAESKLPYVCLHEGADS